ncbi:MAG: YcaO-like family protein [Bacteroidia bacterium]|nr:YcaO-like family protein [Bacteroidia bacterium]
MARTFERQFSISKSLKIAASFCKKKSLSPSFSSEGRKLKTYTCRLFDSLGNIVATGNGKGIGLQSKASAIFEAIEHWHTFNFDNQYESINLFIVRDIPNIAKLADERAIKILLREQKEQSVLCRKYVSIDGQQELYCPLFLSVPTYSSNPVKGDTCDYTYIDHYSTNSGTATGLSTEEALIHAISEIVERDATSLLMLNLFIKKSPDRLVVIDQATIPSRLKEIVYQIERSFNVKIIIIETTTELEIPAFIISILDSKFILNPIGSGCSLFKNYALERALLEVLQSLHLHDNEMEKEDHIVLEEFVQLPNYKECAIFNVNGFISKSHFFFKDFDTCIDYSIPLNMKEHLNILTNIICKRGYEIFFSNVEGFNCEIKCVHTIIPGLEKFNLVRNGHPVLPSVRGNRIINDS